MNRQNLLTIWAKRAVPALALAMMVLPACDKEPETIVAPTQQYDEEILYYYHNNSSNNPKWHIDTIQKYAADKNVRYIYITATNGEKFAHLNSTEIAWHRRELQFAMKESTKCRGRGNFVFAPGRCLQPDSLDLVEMGFTINKQNQH